MKIIHRIRGFFNVKKAAIKGDCPACANRKIIATSTNSFKDFNADHFLEIEQLKHGKILQCGSCQTMWHVGESERWVYTISNDQLESVHEWNNRSLTISPKQLDTLKKIGATPSDLYGNQMEFISIPCRCVLKSGEILETAVISIQKNPPIGLSYDLNKKFHFIDEIVTIESSPFTLPIEVRIATTKAEEVRMSYAPTLVKAPNNKLYITNWTTNFFHEDGIRGEDMRLPSNHENWGNAIDTKNHIPEVRVLADWTKELEALFCELNQKIL